MLTFSCLKFSAHSFFFGNPVLKVFTVGKFFAVIKRKGARLCRFCLRTLRRSFKCVMKTDSLQTCKLQVTFKNTENIAFSSSGVGNPETLNSAPKKLRRGISTV